MRSIADIQAGAAKYLAPYYADIIQAAPAEGQGLLIKTTDGKSFVDFNVGYGANRFGHQYAPVIAAAIGQLQKMTLPSRAFYNDLLVQLGQQYSMIYENILAPSAVLRTETQADIPQCGFKLGGGDAIDAAIKLGLQWGYKHKNLTDGQQIVLMWGGKDLFHGRLVSNLPPYVAEQPTTMSQGFAQLGKAENGFIIGGCPTKILVPLNDRQTLQAAFAQYGERICLAMGEYVLGEGGVQPADPAFLQCIRQLCQQHQALMVADDVQTFAATGHYSPSQHAYFAHHEVKPDVVVVSKAVTAGVVPGSIILARQSVWKYMSIGSDGSTYAGNPVFCAVALATLQAIKQHHLLDKVEHAGAAVESCLRLCQQHNPSISAIRRLGGMLAVEFRDDVSALHYQQRLQQAGKTGDLQLAGVAIEGALIKLTRGKVMRLNVCVMTSAELALVKQLLQQALGGAE
jgi:ornithine--oxo-acid transaminase